MQDPCDDLAEQSVTQLDEALASILENQVLKTLQQISARFHRACISQLHGNQHGCIMMPYENDHIAAIITLLVVSVMPWT
jgi:hypothetical protein